MTARPSQPELRAFVRGHTRLGSLEDAPGIRLQLGDDVMAICGLTGELLGLADPPLPYWAFAWAGGLAVARYLDDRPEEVVGRGVLDLATGSGLCAIVAAKAGALSVRAVDVDPFSEAAVALNARSNHVRIAFTRRDILDDPPPGDVEVILAGDICYEEPMAGRMLGWLRAAAAGGTRVLVGDPGRRFLPADLVRLATYRVRTSRELEDADRKDSAVYTIPAV